MRRGKSSMTDAEKEFVFQQTRASIYYDLTLQSWCAIWLSHGFKEQMLFSPRLNVWKLIKKIKLTQGRKP
jgi:hypothetical protein